MFGNTAKLWLLLGAIYGGVGVGLGAFGAHALKQRLTPEMLAVWRTAVEYQFYHALALLLLGVLARVWPTLSLNLAGTCFALGVLLFSGSLYALALTDIRVLGAITPVGGLLFLVGWFALVWTLAKA